MIRWRPRNVRTRLTLWYVAMLAAVLALYAAFTVAFLHVSLREGLDQALDAEVERVEDALTEGPDGSIRLEGHGDGGSLVEVWSPEGVLLLRRPERATQTGRVLRWWRRPSCTSVAGE